MKSLPTLNPQVLIGRGIEWVRVDLVDRARLGEFLRAGTSPFFLTGDPDDMVHLPINHHPGGV